MFLNLFIRKIVKDLFKFSREVNDKKIVKPGGDCLKFPQKCLTLDQRTEYAYKISKRFIDKLGQQNFFFNSVRVTNKSTQYTKYLLSLSAGHERKQAFLFK